MHQAALLSEAIGVVTLRNEHYFRMILQAGDGFVIQSHIGDEQEFQ